MALLEQEAIRMADALSGYDHLSVSDLGGSAESGYWLTLLDERVGISYDISSHADYWDFLGYFASGLMWPARPFPKRRAA